MNTGWAVDARGQGKWGGGAPRAGRSPALPRTGAGVGVGWSCPTQARVHVAGPGIQCVLSTERLALQNPAQAHRLGTSVRAHRPAPFRVSPTVLTQVLVSMPRCRRKVNRAMAVMGVPQVKMSVSES